MFLGIRTVIYPAPDLAAAAALFTELLGIEPYFSEPFYVGFNVGGYELGLDPNAPVARGAVSYWGVSNADEAMERLLAAGATVEDAVAEPGDGIRIGSVRLAGTGAIFGVIENPVFELRPVASPGPGL